MSAARTQAEVEALLAKVCGLLKNAYGLTVSCDKCGAPELAPCISESGRITVHSTRVTKAVAEIASVDQLETR